MKHRRLRPEGRGGLVLLFLPFTLGSLLFWLFPQPWELPVSRLWPAAVCLVLFSGVSGYGLVLIPLLFLLLGAVAAAMLAGTDPRAFFTSADTLSLLPYFPAMFCASYLGLRQCAFLLSDGRSAPAQRLGFCVKTNLCQLLMLGAAALVSSFLRSF